MGVYRRKAQYHETDQMGIIHHSNYVKWMEEARIDFMKELGFENVYVVPEQELPDGNFPTVSYPNPEAEEAFALGLKLAKEKKKAAAKKPTKKPVSGNYNPVKAGLRARKQAAVCGADAE